MIDLDKIKPLPPTHIDDANFTKKPVDKVIELVDERGFDDKVWAFIIRQDDKIQLVGVAVVTYANKYEGYKKYLIQAFGHGIKYAGKYLDSKIITYDELMERKKNAKRNLDN